VIVALIPTDLVTESAHSIFRGAHLDYGINIPRRR